MAKLGVNIDHVATIREARKTFEPDPVWAATLAELGGADGITIHLREDRRHIQDRDLRLLRETVHSKLNLEMGASEEIIEIALDVKPDQITLVPEKREEITTEGGLDIAGLEEELTPVIKKFQFQGMEVSLFIDPEEAQIVAAHRTGATAIEIHTGAYANARGYKEAKEELRKIIEAATFAENKGLIVHAGHGLTYNNVLPVARVGIISELNIGHSIISRAVLVGLKRAVKEMKRILQKARNMDLK